MGVYGGDGNDTINASGFVTWGLFGGDGDDRIISQAYSDPGDGDQISARVDGGAGDDTLAHQVGVSPYPNIGPAASGPDLTGGEGTDRFEISLVENALPFGGNAQLDGIDVFQNPGGTITDFEQGVDEIVVNLSELPDNFDVVSGTMVEDTENGVTTVTIRLLPTSDTDPTQDVIITINATGLDWNDIVFEGTPPPILAMG